MIAAVWLAVAALEIQVPLGLDAFIPAPASNPITREKAALGRRLFFDPALSRDGTISCSTCHEREHGFTDTRPRAVGIGGRRGPRRSPTLINRAWGKSHFWDGRAATLEEQVLQPIANPDEMDSTPEAAARRVGLASTPELAAALATYVRTILAGGSRYDHYLQGDRAALTLDELAGLKLFRGKANCASCHAGANLTDERFHATGAGDPIDEGRAAITKSGADRGAFKTPTLREVARRAPYMHDGSLTTLAEVIEHYDRGGAPAARGSQRPEHLDPEIQPLHLTAGEKKQLEAFLRSLDGVVKDGYDDANPSAPARPR